MPDPFEALHTPVAPIDPDPAFATRLRARIARALALPKGVIVPETTFETQPRPIAAAPAVRGAAPYLIVADARRALDWYVDVLGARRRGEPIVLADGRIGHAEVSFGADALYLADESPERRVAAPAAGADATVSVVLEVPDVDGVVDRSLDEGAVLERLPANYPHGRNAVIRDPFGHRWIVSATAGEPSTGDVSDVRPPGDIGYVSLWVPDVTRAVTFFGHVLGWRFDPGSGEQGRQVTGGALHHGMWGGQERSSPFVCYVVDHVDAAIDRVRAAGGEADEPTDEPYGRVASCVDDQGTPFAVFRPSAGEPGARVDPNGREPGDVAYVTLEVVDSTRARAFMGAVLGWRFTPGGVPDGWQVDDVRPMVGLHGGHEVATGVPMYRVEDLPAALERVREAGGSAADPERHPYGLTATCVDDQGTRFYLGEL
jgi:predicted enzyme related to lactoylglutathione lyase